MDQKPSIGRIVHYCGKDDDDTRPYAAIITSIGADNEGIVDLYVFGDRNCTPFAVGDAPYSEQPKTGCWMWPPRI
jgi:hypothetical protein